MERTYYLTGTLEELQELLQREFGMEENTARLSVCMLLMDQQQTVDELNETHTAVWYLKKHERFTTPVFKSRFSISLTDAKKSLLDQLIIQFGGMLVDGDAFAFATILTCLLAVYRSGTYIKAEECCVYYQALNWKVTHASQEYFQIQDILPHDADGVCSRLDYIRDGKWVCYSCHKEKCHATERSFYEILNKLCDRNVLKEYNNMYRFTK